MKIKWKTLIFCIIIPLAQGGLSALLTMEGTRAFSLINKPPLSPPGWVFPVVWSALYLLMGYASWRVWRSDSSKKGQALKLYAAQLVANFIWPLLFFGGEWYLAALLWLVLLWVLILLTIRAFSAIDERSGDLLIPYILWVSFAGYLNLGVYLLN